MLEWKTSSEHEKNFFPPQFLKKLVTTTKELFFRCMISMLSDITRLHYQILSDNIVAFEAFASIIVLNVQGRPKAVKAGSIIVSVRFSKQIRHLNFFAGPIIFSCEVHICEIRICDYRVHPYSL